MLSFSREGGVSLRVGAMALWKEIEGHKFFKLDTDTLYFLFLLSQILVFGGGGSKEKKKEYQLQRI